MHTNKSSGKVYLGIERVNSPEFEGIRVLVRKGHNVYTFNSGYKEVERDLGGYIPVTERYGESSPVLKNGKPYLPWQVSASLGNNGLLEGSWIEENNKDPERVVEILQELKRAYVVSFDHCLCFANEIAETDVY